jgi:hypothetical protein
MRFSAMMIRRLATITPSLLIALPLIACRSPQANSTARPAVQQSITVAQVTPTPQPLAQNTESRTVTDYFLNAPDRYFNIVGRTADLVQRQKLLEPNPHNKGNIIDIPNGYLSIGSQSPDLCRYEMAIFRRSRGSHLVALNVSCTSGDAVTILDPDHDWRDITAEALPIALPNVPDTIVQLPRQGKTIIVKQENQPDIKITFQNERFTIAR